MAAINPITLARVSGKEPVFALVFVVIVMVTCYAIHTTGPDYIKKKQVRLQAMQKEIREKMKSEAIKQYQEDFDKVYAPLIVATEGDRFKSAAILMDDLRQQINKNGLRLISMGRSTGETPPITSQYVGVSMVFIKLMFEGELSDALNFMQNFAEMGSYRRVMRLNASASGTDRQAKYNVTLVFPTSDGTRL